MNKNHFLAGCIFLCLVGMLIIILSPNQDPRAPLYVQKIPKCSASDSLYGWRVSVQNFRYAKEAYLEEIYFIEWKATIAMQKVQYYAKEQGIDFFYFELDTLKRIPNSHPTFTFCSREKDIDIIIDIIQSATEQKQKAE